ncbi:hypothetical protein COV18_04055 [Candidatus Woesearchaeota archaeon CG10_big_fil_rev_8_21_14_0_10_37_12]|nr:MAG: hypothetical protein COV18_04055 [Candidatus Woesearchaeota archaeon CG10_big_fil_rev_8_21_14_0_10_37_12]
MEVNIGILKSFFESPNQGFLIRELAKKTIINHTTVRKYILYYLKEGVLVQKKGKPYSVFLANQESKKYKNIKLYYNLELLRMSEIVECLEKVYEYPPIILFGSFARAEDDKNSDVDFCIISNISKKLNLNEYEKKIGKQLSIHQFTKKQWETAKKKNKELVNNIVNGMTLSGQLEVA